MHRISNGSQVAALPSPGAPVGPPGFWSNGQSGSPLIPATILDADFFNSVQEEVAGVIEASGIQLDKTNNAQLIAALRSLFITSAQLGAAIASFPSTTAGMQLEIDNLTAQLAGYVTLAQRAADLANQGNENTALQNQITATGVSLGNLNTYTGTSVVSLQNQINAINASLASNVAALNARIDANIAQAHPASNGLGYFMFPGGLIGQWFPVALAAGVTSVYATLPIFCPRGLLDARAEDTGGLCVSYTVGGVNSSTVNVQAPSYVLDTTGQIIPRGFALAQVFVWGY